MNEEVKNIKFYWVTAEMKNPENGKWIPYRKPITSSEKVAKKYVETCEAKGYRNVKINVFAYVEENPVSQEEVKLKDLVEVAVNNDKCVILNVKDNVNPISLMSLGVFNGDEVSFRVSKRPNHEYTVWYKDGDKTKSYSWNDNTLVTDSMGVKADMLKECIEELGIKI